jgi:ABC-type Fe3+-hydroxamate transport system substrate-binding protein
MSKIIEAVTTPVEEIEETKAETFRRLANKRTTVALDKIRLIGNLANRAIYEYEEEQVERIIEALRMQIDRIDNKFKHVKPQKETFEL